MVKQWWDTLTAMNSELLIWKHDNHSFLALTLYSDHYKFDKGGTEEKLTTSYPLFLIETMSHPYRLKVHQKET